MGNLFVLSLIFISRILFLSPLPIYFDSPEYVRLIENPSLLQALTSGHEPIHPGYILPSWILFKIFPFFGAIYSAEIVSSIFATLGLFVFYKAVKLLFDRKTATRAFIIASLLPVLYLAGINVLTDTTYIFFYIFSFYCLLLFSRTNKKKWLVLGILSLAYSIFTHTQVILWLPVFFAPIFLIMKKRQQVFKKTILFLTLGVSLGIISLVFLLSLIGNSILESLQLLFMHGADIYGTGDVAHDTLRAIRNFGIIMLRNNSTLVVFAAFIGSIILFRKDKRKLAMLLLWLAPSLLATQYWHIGLFGRVALIASFPIAVLVAQIKSRLIFAVIVLQLLVIFIPLAITNRNATVQKELGNLYSSIPKNSVLISSNLIRPQVTYKGETYFINEPGQDLKFIESRVNLALKQNKNVHVDSQALYNPYYSYDGNHLHILSLGKIGNSKVKTLLDRYTLRIVETSNNPRIFLYKIEGSSNRDSKYTFLNSQEFKDKIHSERIDYGDVGTWLWAVFSKKHEPVFWGIN